MGSVLLLLAGFGLLLAGGEALVRGSAGLGLRLGLTPLIVGLTIVAVGTSAPELAVSVGAALGGHHDVAVANVVGSNIANLALVLGMTALVRRLGVNPRFARRDLPFMVACGFALALMLVDGVLGRYEAGVLLFTLLAYWVYGFRLHLSDRGEAAEQEVLGHVDPLAVQLVLIVAGSVALAFGGDLLIDAVVDLAATLGVSEAAIGLTVVALGTSLPEVVTSVVAALRRQGDMALGNVVGSNVVNITLVLGTAGLLTPLTVADVGWLDLAVMLAVSLLAWLFALTGHRVTRREGAALLLAYAAYVVLVFRPMS